MTGDMAAWRNGAAEYRPALVENGSSGAQAKARGCRVRRGISTNADSKEEYYIFSLPLAALAAAKLAVRIFW